MRAPNARAKKLYAITFKLKGSEGNYPKSPLLGPSMCTFTFGAPPNVNFLASTVVAVSQAICKRSGWFYMGARRNFSRGGQSHRQFKKSTRFRRAVQEIDHLSARRRRKRKFLHFSRRLRLKCRVSSASAEGASKNFRVFCRTAAYDVIFSNSRGGGQVPSPCPPCGRPWLQLTE